MFSPAELIVIGAAALIVFGPEQLPKVARKTGQVMREVQNTSLAFVREMERAADDDEHAVTPETESERGDAAFAHEDASGI